MTAPHTPQRPHRELSRALVVCALLALGPSVAHGEGSRRFALIVGNDLGGEGTQPLLYAREDARKVQDVLMRLGGVNPQDTVTLLGRGAETLIAAMDDLESRIRAAERGGVRTTFVLYYSGHAKDGELQLGRTRVALDEVKRRVQSSAASLRIAIIDSCRSGAVTRSKGARLAPSFAIEATGANLARGTVFLTSSSFDEDAQESDHIGGSYFSHHFVNGLQGDADRSGDGRVTLAEAYAHAYARTVADTAASQAGAQHPTFSYDLKGNGDFVISEYAQRQEGVYFPAEGPAGTYFLVDSRGIIAAEIEKGAGRARRVAVRPGRYTIKRRLPDRLRVGHVDVAAGRLSTLHEGTLRDAAFSDDPVKGVERDVASRYNLSLGAAMQSFFDEPTRQGLFPNAGLLGLELSIADFLRRDWLLGFDIAVGGGDGLLVRDAVDVTGLPFRMNQVSLGASLVSEWPFLDGDLAPFAGVRLAFMLMTRQFEEATLPEQYFQTFSPGIQAGLRYRLSRRLQLIGRTRVHYLLYNVDQDLSLGFWDLTLAMGYDF
jgi:hypothetical protein